MKLDLKTTIAHGNPQQLQAVIQKEFGADLPIKLLEDFTCKPEAAVVFRCSNGQVTGIVRSPGVITRGIRDVANNIKAIFYWREGGSLQAKMLQD